MGLKSILCLLGFHKVNPDSKGHTCSRCEHQESKCLSRGPNIEWTDAGFKIKDANRKILSEKNGSLEMELGPSDDQPKHFYWWVSFSFTNKVGKTGEGATALYSSKQWFPIRASSDWIMQSMKLSSVVIKNWKSITIDQYSELQDPSPEDEVS